MGEITDALRRARLEEERARSDSREAPPLDREEALAAEEPSIAIPIEESKEDPPEAGRPEHTRQLKEVARVQIPRAKTGFWQPRAVLVDPPLPAAEAFRHFAVQVNRELEQRRRRSVLITSALPLEGKTTVACNLALAIASMAGGGRTALVDLDLHRGKVRKAMGISPDVGFEQVLSGEVPLEAARLETDIPGFDLYPVASPRREAHELISGPHFQAAVDLLTSNYEKVVFDGPPVLPVPDVALAANRIATCIVVTRRGVTRRRAYRELLSTVPREKFMGAFLNDTREFGRSHRYGYYDVEEEEEPGASE